MEADADFVAQDAADRAGDDGAHLSTKPLADEVGGRSDKEGAIVGGEAHRILEPRVVIGAGDLELELSEGSVPCTAGNRVFHRFPLRRAQGVGPGDLGERTAER